MTQTRTSPKTELRKLFIDEVRDVYWAERHLLKTLPTMAEKANNPDLKEAFQSHWAETETHIDRLERIFELLELKPRAEKCDAMDGIVSEGEELIEDFEDSPALDAALILAAQKAEHYEIATYGTMRAFAKCLGYSQIVDIISDTIEEEGEADKKLTKIAERCVNEEAHQQ